jgi:hypothetical protein
MNHNFEPEAGFSPILGNTSPDPVGKILGTGYDRFERPDGVNGLAKAQGRRLDILALYSEFENRGYVTRFIEEAKQNYGLIYVWHVDNPILKEALARWGFKPCHEAVSCNGKVEWCDGMMWERL